MASLSPFFRFSGFHPHLAALLLAGSAVPLIASEPPAIPKTQPAPWQGSSDRVIDTEIFIGTGSDKVWTLPTVEKGQRVALKITARRQTPKLGGYGYYIQYELNGKPLDASINRVVPRLLNKPLFFRRPDGNEVFWNLGDGVWHVFFAPDFETDVARYGPKAEEEPFTITLDVTDLLKPGEENRFSARNMLSPAGGKDIPVVVSLSLVSAPAAETKALPEAPVIAGKPTVELEKGGAFTLVFGKIRLPFESRFSFPKGTFNHLAVAPAEEGEKGWKPEVRQLDGNRWEITAAGESYRVVRTVELQDHRVVVEDRYTNLTAEPLGIRLSNFLSFGEEALYSCRMGGQASESVNDLFSPANSTLFFAAKESSLGIVLEDDVLRNQSILFYDLKDRQAGVKDDLFSLRPNASYTARWSVYFQPDSDYYTFINTVRRDWGVNYRLEGPVYFDNYHRLAASTDEQAEKLLNNRKPKYLVFWEVRRQTPSEEWGDKVIMGNGTGLLEPVLADEIATLRKAIARAKRVSPDLKVSLYTHSFFLAPERPESERYRDSWIVDPDGKRKQSVYNSPSRVDFLTVYPTLENSYGKDYLKLVDFYLNDLGLDWLYWDESLGPGVTNSNVFASGRQDAFATFDTWDGHTALIHRRKKTVEKPFAMLPLITRPLFEEVIRRTKEKGGFVLFNSAASTKLRIGSPAFTETQDTLTRGYELHLDSPLAYGYGSPTMADIRNRLKVGLIYARTHLDYPSEVVARCYPFTPEELHAGWVKGKERIVTSIDGAFGWEGDAGSLRLALFDSDGQLIQDDPVQVGENGKVAINVPEGGVAILERADLSDSR